MKKIVSIGILILILCTTSTGQAQNEGKQNLTSLDRQPYYFGFLLGVNQMNFAIKSVDNLAPFDTLMSIQPVPQMGFNIGIVSNLSIGKFWDVRFIPTLSFGERDLSYTFYHPLLGVSTQTIKKVESIFMDFPFMLKLKSSRIGNNTRAYVIAGGQVSIDMASQSKNKSENPEDINIKLYRDDYTLLAGVGFDFYMEYFKMGVELKMSYGFSDRLLHENNMFAQSIERLNSKIFQLSLTFEGGKY